MTTDRLLGAPPRPVNAPQPGGLLDRAASTAVDERDLADAAARRDRIRNLVVQRQQERQQRQEDLQRHAFQDPADVMFSTPWQRYTAQGGPQRLGRLRFQENEPWVRTLLGMSRRDWPSVLRRLLAPHTQADQLDEVVDLHLDMLQGLHRASAGPSFFGAAKNVAFGGLGVLGQGFDLERKYLSEPLTAMLVTLATEGQLFSSELRTSGADMGIDPQVPPESRMIEAGPLKLVRPRDTFEGLPGWIKTIFPEVLRLTNVVLGGGLAKQAGIPVLGALDDALLQGSNLATSAALRGTGETLKLGLRGTGGAINIGGRIARPVTGPTGRGLERVLTNPRVQTGLELAGRAGALAAKPLAEPLGRGARFAAGLLDSGTRSALRDGPPGRFPGFGPPPLNKAMLEGWGLGDAADFYRKVALSVSQAGWGKYRPLAALVSIINPNGVPLGIGTMGKRVRDGLLLYFDSVATTVMDRFRVIGDEAEVFGYQRRAYEFADDATEGVAKRGTLDLATQARPKPGFEDASLAWHDVMEYGDARYILTPKLQQYREEVIGLITALRQMAESEGLVFRDVIGLEADRTYIPRWVAQIQDFQVQSAIGGGNRVNRKKFFEHTRFWELASDGMMHGVEYHRFLATMDTYIKAIGDSIATQRGKQIWDPFGVAPEALVDAAVKSAVHTAANIYRNMNKVVGTSADPGLLTGLTQGQRIPNRTIEALSKQVPEIAAELGALNNKATLTRQGILTELKGVANALDSLSSDLVSGSAKSRKEIAARIRQATTDINRTALSETRALKVRITHDQRILSESLIDGLGLDLSAIRGVEKDLASRQVRTMDDVVGTLLRHAKKPTSEAAVRRDVQRYLRASGLRGQQNVAALSRELAKGVRATLRLNDGQVSENLRRFQAALGRLNQLHRDVANGSVKDMGEILQLVGEGRDAVRAGTKDVRRLASELRRPVSREVREEAQKLREKFLAAKEEARGHLRDARKARDAALEAVRGGATTNQGRVVPVPKLGKLYPEDMAKELNQILNEDVNGWLKNMSDISSAVVTLRASTDFSNPLIQGLIAAGDNPLAWGKATIMHLAAFFDPKVGAAYRASHADEVAEAIQAGIHMSSNDIFESATRGLVGKVPGARNVVRRFNVAFDTFGDILRTEQWIAQRSAARGNPGFTGRLLGRQPLRLTAEEIQVREAQLAQFINKSTGVMDTRGLGLSANQRHFERGFLFFSPRYTRSYIGLMADMGRGGYAGNRAREAMARLGMAGIGTYYVAALGLGMSHAEILEGLNPRNPNFLKLDIGGDRGGVGGVVRALMKAIAKTTEDLYKDPASVFSFDSDAARFFRSRMAPVGGIIWDQVIDDGTNFIGEDVGVITNPGRFFASNSLPFSMDGRVMGHPRSGWPTLPLEMTGFNIYPVPPWDQADRLRDLRAQELYDEDYDALNRLQQREIDADPEIQERLEMAARLNRERGDGLSLRIQQVKDQRLRLFKTKVDKQERIDHLYEMGLIDGYWWRKQRSRIYQTYSDKYEELDDPFAELDLAEESNAFDVAAQEFFRAIDVKNFENQHGEIDFEARELEIERQRDAVHPDVAKYITAVWLYYKTPTEIRFIQAQERLRPYRELWKQVVGNDPYMNPVYDRYRELSNVNRQAAAEYERANPVVGAINRRVDALKQSMRLERPDIDADLVRWYGLTPIRQQGRRR